MVEALALAVMNPSVAGELGELRLLSVSEGVSQYYVSMWRSVG
jgi:hypothetical protein